MRDVQKRYAIARDPNCHVIPVLMVVPSKRLINAFMVGQLIIFMVKCYDIYGGYYIYGNCCGASVASEQQHKQDLIKKNI